MIRKSKILDKFEKDLLSGTPADYEHNLKIAEALLQEAHSLGVLPLKDPLDAIEVDINLARVLNSVRVSSKASVRRT